MRDMLRRVLKWYKMLPFGTQVASLLLGGLWMGLGVAHAQPQLTLEFGSGEGPQQVVPALKVLFALTVLTLAPAILISMTAFTRIVIVLSFVRQAMGTQNVPPLHVVMSLALLLTGVVMVPVARELDTQVLSPYTEETIDEEAAFGRAATIARAFLMPHTRESDLLMFYELTKTERPRALEDVALYLLVPAFMLSELRTGFEMGFLIFLPFVLIDMVVASILTSMGMVMLPPTMMSIPLKLLLFVSIDGWHLMTRSLVESFQ